MTRRQSIVWRRVVPATVIASLLLAVACETPRPAPVAPIAVQNDGAREQSAFTEIEKDKTQEVGFSVVVFSSEGKRLARYAGEIPVAHLPKDGVQSVKAEERTCGTTTCYAVRITLKPGYALRVNNTEIDLLPHKRGEVRSDFREFAIPEVTLTKRDHERIIVKDARLTTKGGSLFGPVELQGHARVEVVRDAATKIREVSVPLRESIDPKKLDVPREVRGEGKRLAFTVTRDRSAAAGVTETEAPPRLVVSTEKSLPEPVDFELLSSSGEVVSRYTTNKMPKEIRVDDIDAIEVYKSSSCSAGSSCSLIRITLKTGRDRAYRKE